MSFNVRRTPLSKRVSTYEGGTGFQTTDPRLELYLLACGSLMLGDTFYQSKDERVKRFRRLVRETLGIVGEGRFVANLAMYAREQLHLRQLPTLLTAELFLNGEGEYGAEAARRVWVRGDEHLEAIAYADQFKTKALPRGLLRAVRRHLEGMNETQFMKYARESRAVSQVDAMNLAHPKAKSPAQAALFKMVVEGWDALSDAEQALLPKYQAVKAGEGQTWEQRISMGGSTAENWESTIPKMGYMALLRNLRNFVEKGVSAHILMKVADRISAPNEVRYSKQLPFRFINAYNALPANAPRYLREAISTALDISLENVPQLPGNTLVVVDGSGSMQAAIGGGEMSAATAAATLAAAVYLRNDNTTISVFADRAQVITPDSRSSVLAVTDAIAKTKVGWSTHIAKGIAEGYKVRPRYNRVIVLTDAQAHDNPWSVLRSLQPDVPAYEVNLMGYGSVAFDPRNPNVTQIAGFSDKLFDFIRAAERTDPVKFIREYA